jgi:hypothetical protein
MNIEYYECLGSDPPPEGGTRRSTIYLSRLFITYELLGLVIERSSNIVSLFKELENIRIDA